MCAVLAIQNQIVFFRIIQPVMLRQVINWKTALAIVAMLIVTGTIFYSQYLARKIARDERARVTAIGEALRIKSISDDPNVLEFTNEIAIENKDIPIIETDEKDH